MTIGRIAWVIFYRRFWYIQGCNLRALLYIVWFCVRSEATLSVATIPHRRYGVS
jgi:hypothetical protein